MLSRQRLNRRNFLQQGGSGLLSTAALPLLGAGSVLTPSSPLPQTFLPTDTDKETIEKAKRNIEEVRKRQVELTLLDKFGSPIQNQELSIKQLKHQFLFGEQNWGMATMQRNGVIEHDRAKYLRERFAKLLNALNTTVYWTERPRNDGTKTEDFQGDLRLADFEESVNWANANGLTAKGHPLFWTVPKAIPEWLKKYPMDTFMAYVEVRIRNLCARFQGRVKVWDAVNEMLWETHPKNLSKRVWPYTETVENMVDYISKILKWGREEDPEALFCINDYGISKVNREGLIDQNGDPVDAARQRKRYVELVQRLGDAGYPPNLLGIQGRPAWINPSQQVAVYDELSEAGIPISVTEFWANTKYLQNAANRQSIESEEWRSIEEQNIGKDLTAEQIEAIRDEFVLNYLTCAFGHPNIDSFYFWGFIGSAVKFAPSPSSGHTLAPIYDKVWKLLHEEWNTSLTLQTDAEGKVRFRAFCGDYTARVQHKRSAKTPIGMRFTVDKNMMVNRPVLKVVM
ncbi:MAG: endo-1,4-beta-xylanase [Saprospiraceae bacterium]|nr:endo-1,4-beta-xylanase [Saprospiraceae bacterium]